VARLQAGWGSVQRVNPGGAVLAAWGRQIAQLLCLMVGRGPAFGRRFQKTGARRRRFLPKGGGKPPAGVKKKKKNECSGQLDPKTPRQSGLPKKKLGGGGAGGEKIGPHGRRKDRLSRATRRAGLEPPGGGLALGPPQKGGAGGMGPEELWLGKKKVGKTPRNPCRQRAHCFWSIIPEGGGSGGVEKPPSAPHLFFIVFRRNLVPPGPKGTRGQLNAYSWGPGNKNEGHVAGPPWSSLQKGPTFASTGGETN